MADVSVERSQIIKKHEESIILSFNAIYVILGGYFQKFGYCIEYLEELADLTAVGRIFSNNDISVFIDEGAIVNLNFLKESVKELRMVLVEQDKELAQSLEYIDTLIQIVVSDYFSDLEIKKGKMTLPTDKEYWTWLTKDSVIKSDGRVKDEGIENETEEREDENVKEEEKEEVGEEDEEQEEDEVGQGEMKNGISVRILNIEGCLEFYTLTFIEAIENIFMNAANYLDGKCIDVRLSPTILRVIDLCSRISNLKTIGILAHELAVYFHKRSIKDIAAIIPYPLIDNIAEKIVRNVLIKGAYKIFSHYEYQFSLIQAKRYAKKLAMDSADRYVYYLLSKPNLNAITSIDVVRGILEGKSTLNPNRLFFQRGHTLRINKMELSTDDFFTRIGIREEMEDNIVHYSKWWGLSYLKFRLKFPWDDLSHYTKIKYEHFYTYKYNTIDQKCVILALFEKIKSLKDVENETSPF